MTIQKLTSEPVQKRIKLKAKRHFDEFYFLLYIASTALSSPLLFKQSEIILANVLSFPPI